MHSMGFCFVDLVSNSVTGAKVIKKVMLHRFTFFNSSLALNKPSGDKHLE